MDTEHTVFEKVDGLGTICLYEKESDIPHFDIIRDNGSRVSIMIENNSVDALSNDELEILNDWLKKPSKNLSGLGSNWSDIIFGWYGLYPNSKFEYNWKLGIPNYTTIKPCD